MPADGPLPISITDALATLRFLPDRTPTTTPEQSEGAFSRLSNYRDGGIFIGHWSGTSEWERHGIGDEIVLILEGSTTIFFLSEGVEQSAPLRAGELVVVPRYTWHRFETPDQVKLLAVTPYPTDHRSERPD
jgi:mannose-6-phosphate isomerase-like protein (cupin superfamily)